MQFLLIATQLALASVPVPEVYEEDAPDMPKGWSVELAELGRQLFFDKRFSKDKSISCATCHDPKHAFTDGKPVAVGVGGAKGARNTPTVVNRALGETQFWDGRAKTLEEQALGPMMAPVEMAMNEELVLKRLRRSKKYRKQFKNVFGKGPSLEGVAKAIAAFERTVYSVDAPFDKFNAGDRTAMSDAAQRGLVLLGSKAKVAECHTGVNFSGEDFHVLGVSKLKGRAEVTGKKEDEGAYKTPTLRDVTRTGPYMHDGSVETLEEVIEFYNKGGEPHPNLSDKMLKLDLTDQEKSDLLEFIKALTGTLTFHGKPS
jgi:cytochrome c peroxidase